MHVLCISTAPASIMNDIAKEKTTGLREGEVSVSSSSSTSTTTATKEPTRQNGRERAPAASSLRSTAPPNERHAHGAEEVEEERERGRQPQRDGRGADRHVPTSRQPSPLSSSASSCRAACRRWPSLIGRRGLPPTCYEPRRGYAR